MQISAALCHLFQGSVSYVLCYAFMFTTVVKSRSLSYHSRPVISTPSGHVSLTSPINKSCLPTELPLFAQFCFKL